MTDIEEPNYDPDAEFHDAQNQDMLEKEERLTEILWELRDVVHMSSTFLTVEDVDFVAAACGLSNYRKPEHKPGDEHAYR